MRVLTGILLFVLWLSLSVTLSPAYVLVGAIIAALVAWLNPALPHMRNLSLTAIIAYQPWIFGRVLKSGIHVSRLILDPALPIAPRLMRRQTPLRGDGELVVLGNSITLTPGTITVEIAPGEVLIHAIDAASCEDLVGGALEAKVQQVFPAAEHRP